MRDLLRLLTLLIAIPLGAVLIGPALVLAAVRRTQRLGPITLTALRGGSSGRLVTACIGLALWAAVWGGLTLLVWPIAGPALASLSAAPNVVAQAEPPTPVTPIAPPSAVPSSDQTKSAASAASPVPTIPAVVSPTSAPPAATATDTIAPSPTPTDTSTPLPTATATPEPTPTQLPSPTNTLVVATAAPPTLTPSPSATARPTDTPWPMPTLWLTPTPLPTATARPTATPAPPPTTTPGASSATTPETVTASPDTSPGTPSAGSATTPETLPAGSAPPQPLPTSTPAPPVLLPSAAADDSERDSIAAVESANELLRLAIEHPTTDRLAALGEHWQDRALPKAQTFARAMYYRVGKPVTASYVYLIPPTARREPRPDRVWVDAIEVWTYQGGILIYTEHFHFHYTLTQQEGRWVIVDYTYRNAPAPRVPVYGKP